MTNRDLIALLAKEDPDAEAMLVVDIQGELELRPVGAVRATNLWLENDIYLVVSDGTGFRGVVLDPDHTVDENIARKRELERTSRLKDLRDALPIDPAIPAISVMCLDSDFGFYKVRCTLNKGHAGMHSDGIHIW